MTNGVGGNLGGLLQPFDDQSPINRIAALVQMAQKNPQALAALLAKTGAQPPPVPTLAGGGGFGGLVGGQGRDVLGGGGGQTDPGLIPGSPAGGLLAGPISTPPVLPATASPAASAATGGEQPGRLEGILKAVSQLEAPPVPELPRAPAAQLPRPGGPAPNPELLALLAKLLQGAQPQGIPQLGQLIAGNAGAPAAPTVQF